MTKPIVIPFGDARATDPALTGGKGSRLAELTALGLPVPTGYVITTEAFKRTITSALITTKFITALDASSELERQTFIGTRLQQVLKTMNWPIGVTDRIMTSLAQMCGTKPVAVRSSAVGEDGEATSFAGQHSTSLNVTSALLSAVQDCYASLYSPRAIYYRSHHNLSFLDSEMAVVVQQMVNARYSGVLFTRNPVTGENHSVIEETTGLGEKLVSGEVTPSRFTVTKKSRKIVNLPSYFANTPFEMNLMTIAGIGEYLEQHYGEPQDIEWVVDMNDNVHIVQARPLTVVPGSSTTIETDVKPLCVGTPAAPWVGYGPARWVGDSSQLAAVQEGDVVFTSMTSPDFVPIFSKIAGLVTLKGGMTCHAAIVSREYRLPCVVGTSDVSGTIKDGDVVTVDGRMGTVYIGNKLPT